jgi:hypothetical protein
MDPEVAQAETKELKTPDLFEAFDVGSDGLSEGLRFSTLELPLEPPFTMEPFVEMVFPEEVTPLQHQNPFAAFQAGKLPMPLVGRKWLFPRIAQWFQESKDCNTLLITGDPGTFSSMFFQANLFPNLLVQVSENQLFASSSTTASTQTCPQRQSLSLPLAGSTTMLSPLTGKTFSRLHFLFPGSETPSSGPSLGTDRTRACLLERLKRALVALSLTASCTR